MEMSTIVKEDRSLAQTEYIRRELWVAARLDAPTPDSEAWMDVKLNHCKTREEIAAFDELWMPVYSNYVRYMEESK